jgi:hypothetical protein
VRACEAQRAVLGLLLAILCLVASGQAHAQFATPTGHYAGTAGSSCAGLGQQYAWPDANGQILQCVSNVWTLVSPSSVSSGVYLGTSTSLANPTRSASELNTGLFSPASGAVGIVSLGTEQMRVTGGKVGIGTTAPASLLDAYGGGDERITARSSDISSGNYTGFQLASGAGTTFEGGMYINNANKGVVEFWNATNDVMALSGSNVGIGTVSPGFPLTVNGNIGLLPNGSTNRTKEFGNS